MSQAAQRRLKSIIKSKLCFSICSTPSSFVVLYISPWFYAYTNKSHTLFLLLYLSFFWFFYFPSVFLFFKFSLGLSIISPLLFGATIICLEDEFVLSLPVSCSFEAVSLGTRQRQAWPPKPPQSGAGSSTCRQELWSSVKYWCYSPGIQRRRDRQESEFPGVEKLWWWELHHKMSFTVLHFTNKNLGIICLMLLIELSPHCLSCRLKAGWLPL